MFRSLSVREKSSNFYNTQYHYSYPDGDIRKSIIYSREKYSIPPEKLINEISRKKISHVIDLGCGIYIERLLASYNQMEAAQPKYMYTYPSYTGIDINQSIINRCSNQYTKLSCNTYKQEFNFICQDILHVKYDKLIKDIRSKSQSTNGKEDQKVLIIASDLFGFNTVTDNIALFERLAKIKENNIYFMTDNYTTSRQNGIDFNIIDGYMHNLLACPFDLDLCLPILTGTIRQRVQVRGSFSSHEYIMYTLDVIKNAFGGHTESNIIGQKVEDDNNNNNKRKKKVLFLAWQDFANVCSDLSWNINRISTTYESKVVCKIPHPFNYKHKHDLDLMNILYFEKDILTEEEYQQIEKKVAIISWARNVDIVYFSDEMQELLNANEPNPYLRPKDVLRSYLMGWTHLKKSASWISWHAGCSFRALHGKHNAIDMQYVKKQIVNHDLYHCALLDKSVPKLGMCISYSFSDEEKLMRKLYMRLNDTSSTIRVTHSPSDYYIKGTPFIRKAIELIQMDIPSLEYTELGGPLNTTNTMKHTELIEKRYSFDFYIDQFNPIIGGIGISSFEAIKDGIITFCTYDNLTKDVFVKCGFPEEAYDSMPIIALSLTDNEKKILDGHKEYTDKLQSLPMNNIQLNNAMVMHLVNVMKPYFSLDKKKIMDLALAHHRWIKQYFNSENIVRIFEESIR